MATAVGPVVWTWAVSHPGSESTQSILPRRLEPIGVVLAAALGLGPAACTETPQDDVAFTTGGSGSTSGTPVDPTTTEDTVEPVTTVDPDSTGELGCNNDQDCIDDPGGPFCDDDTRMCVSSCVPGDMRACYSGPVGTEGIGACAPGIQLCLDAGVWSSFCDGEVIPIADDCNANGVDDDCDGMVDDSDSDGDGYGACTSDCCDVEGGGCEGAVFVNPGAYEVDDNEIDDDCDGEIDEVTLTCDAGLMSSSSNAQDYARAMELCQFTEEDPAFEIDRVWGVIEASLTRANGLGLPLPVQRSLRADFGDIIEPEAGDRMAVLSSGHAADATDTNPTYAPFQSGINLGITSDAPADWLAANGGEFPNPAGCAEPWDFLAHDPIMLNLRVRVPTNARSFSVQVQYFSAEYPEWVCSEFNDFFVALLDSTAENPADKNIAVYDDGNEIWPLGVNLVLVADGLFTQCENGDVGCANGGGFSGEYDGCLGTALLEGTGFDANGNACGGGQSVAGGGTGWLRMSGNVTPGEIMDLRLAIWDTSGHIYDSLVLLDEFRWSLEAATPGVAPG